MIGISGLLNRLRRPSSLSPVQLRSLLDQALRGETLSRDEGLMMMRILSLADTPISSIMIPKSQIVRLEASSTIGQTVDTFVKSGHSRLPVYDTDPDNIIGIIHVKELLRLWKRPAHNIRAVEFIRLPNFFPQTMKVAQALAEFRRRNISVALAIDEYGVPTGMITTEDLVEQVVGELNDEYNVKMRHHRLLENGDWLVDSGMPLDKFQSLFQQDLPSRAHTLSGYIMETLQRIPSPGERFTIGRLECQVESASRSRIEKIVVKRLQP